MMIVSRVVFAILMLHRIMFDTSRELREDSEDKKIEVEPISEIIKRNQFK